MKKLAALLLGLMLAFWAAGCTRASKLPAPEQLISYSYDELEKLAASLKEKDLLKRFGTPEDVEGRLIWLVQLDGGCKYIEAFAEKGNIRALRVSQSLFITVVQNYGDTYIGLASPNSYTDEAAIVLYLPSADMCRCTLAPSSSLT